MPIQSPRWPYTKTLVEQAPDEWGGEYALWAGDELLHIGHAMDGGRSLKASLKEHLLGRCSVCTGKATHYAWESTDEGHAHCCSTNRANRYISLRESLLTLALVIPKIADRSGRASTIDDV